VARDRVRARPDPRIPPLLDRLGAPVIDPLIGGDATLLFGAR
jgi:hypothetical protein